MKTTQRTYSSPLREQQQEDTRQRIIQAAVDCIADAPGAEFTHEGIARRAGIAPRTVYRHFPVRTALMDAVWQESDRRLGLTHYPDTEESLLAGTRSVVSAMDANPGLINGLIRSEAGLEMRRRDNERRRVAVQNALAKATAHLDEAGRNRVVGIFQALHSARMWQMLRERAQLDGNEPAEAIVWAMTTLIDALYREQKAAARKQVSGDQDRPKAASPGKTKNKK